MGLGIEFVPWCQGRRWQSRQSGSGGNGVKRLTLACAEVPRNTGRWVAGDTGELKVGKRKWQEGLVIRN